MKKIVLLFTLVLTTIGFSQDLIHYWNFNNETSVDDMLIPSQTIGGAEIVYLNSVDSELAIGTGQNFDIENLNAKNDDVAGSHLRFNNPIGGEIVFFLPTTGYEAVVISFATKRSGSGAGNQIWSYSTDGGVSYEYYTTIQPNNGDPALVQFDLAAFSAINNNADFRLKVEFEAGDGGTAGNNRIDNFTLEGVEFGTSEPSSPSITVTPNELVDFEQTLGYPSTQQTLVVSGAFLTGNINVTVTGAYEVSLTSGENFSTTVVLEHTSGVISNVPLYIRLNAEMVGEYISTIVFESEDATQIEINLTGEAVEPDNALLYYWHFNDLTTVSDVTQIDADFTLISGFTGSFEYTDPITGERDIDRYSPGTSMNIQMGVNIGSAARVRNPAATRSLVFNVPTTGAENIVFTYAIQRSSNGSQTNTIEYSLDGNTFIAVGLVDNTQDVNDVEVWQVLSYDFSSIEGANDNPNFKIRIIWEHENAANPSGNNRYDNITISGVLLQDDLSIFPQDLVKVNIYPNPTTDVVTFESDEVITALYVFDLSGVVLIEQTNLMSQTLSVNLENYTSGSYIALVKTANGYTQVRLMKK
jgi:hypothetical protein